MAARASGWVFGWATSLTLLAGSAAAQGVSPPTATRVEASEGARTHDGFFFRIGLNLGPLMMTRRYAVDHQEGHSYEDEYGGPTFGQDFMLGGTPSDGLVIGGALIAAATWPATRTTDLDPSGRRSRPTDPVIFAGVAAFGNYYFDPKVGFHLQALLGYSMVHRARPNSSYSLGPMLGAGVGYDFFFADEWSVGPFARLIYAPSSGEDDREPEKYHYLLPSIGVAITLH
jgi:hypothetical protein